jgi:hypothetical protein
MKTRVYKLWVYKLWKTQILWTPWSFAILTFIHTCAWLVIIQHQVNPSDDFLVRGIIALYIAHWRHIWHRITYSSIALSSPTTLRMPAPKDASALRRGVRSWRRLRTSCLSRRRSRRQGWGQSALYEASWTNDPIPTKVSSLESRESWLDAYVSDRIYCADLNRQYPIEPGASTPIH